MTGVGLILIAVGYGITYWGVHALEGQSQGSFVTYIFPFAK